MIKIIRGLLMLFLLLQGSSVSAQKITFEKIQDNKHSFNYLGDIAQDSKGYLWMIGYARGLLRYDGTQIKSYPNDPTNPASIISNNGAKVIVAKSGIVWIGTSRNGLEKFDPETETFSHFRHDSSNASSLINDTITSLLEDHLGNIWIGTKNGLDKMDVLTGRFTHFLHVQNDPGTISDKMVNVLYEDKKGTIWAGCGSMYDSTSIGGLNKLDSKTGKFTRYQHQAGVASSLEHNNIGALFEDSKGNFWVGSQGDGLHMMDRQKGTFIHYRYDAASPEKLSRPQVLQEDDYDQISDIKEDLQGNIWIGTYFQGIGVYNTKTEKLIHFGLSYKGSKIFSTKDTSSGFSGIGTQKILSTNDGIVWIISREGSLLKADLSKTIIPYFEIEQHEANSMYYDDASNQLWIATDDGFVCRNITNSIERVWTNDPKDSTSLPTNIFYAVRPAAGGKFWLGSVGEGLCLFDTTTKKVITYRPDNKVKGSISDVLINALHTDKKNRLWIGINGKGADRFEPGGRGFINYGHILKDSNSLASNDVFCIANGQGNQLWFATGAGLDMFDEEQNRFYHYLPNSIVRTVCVDKNNIVWAGAEEAIYHFDTITKKFIVFKDKISGRTIAENLHIIEDNNSNLWVSTRNSIAKINRERTEVKIFDESYGVRRNEMGWSDNFKTKDGRLIIGHFNGYYFFDPEKFAEDNHPPHFSFTMFKLGNEIMKSTKDGVLTAPIWDTKDISLAYNQDNFLFEFVGIDFRSNGEKKYLYKLENYDNEWRDIGTDHRAYFYNVPPGKYVFKARCFSSDNQMSEISVNILITPPWWRTWWAYSLFALLAIGIIWTLVQFRSKALRRENLVLEEKVAHRTQQLQHSIETLKSTQSQLVQSEKMASLGELTAGIAHEIQNPLNFVNNFSEVNKELIVEMVEEVEKGNFSEVKAIANDIKENEEKINHHGKRADAIVKGMLQHSRASSGQKEPTDINALCDEYLRLSYHGLRAKDKSFNATLKTDFDESIGKINVIPQDLGRVIMNLVTNAFYAVNEKKKSDEGSAMSYEPVVSVSTKKINNKVEIMVSDNGNGIPDSIKEKIFQPFFTTKPTGQGTGLGLSLAYDIVKSHNGNLQVRSNKGNGSSFIITLAI